MFDRKYTNRKCCCVINVMCMLDVGSRRVTSSPAVCRTPVSELVLLIRVTRQRAAPKRGAKSAVYCSVSAVWMLDVGSRRATSSPAVCRTPVGELVLLIRVTRQRAVPERRVVKPAVYCSVWMLDVGSRWATSSPAVCLTRVNWCC